MTALNPSILGLDCEWVGKNKVCLLQLGHPKLIILIRLHKLKIIPTELIGLLSNNKILKCGVGIYNDASKLRYDYNVDTFGCVDINDIFPLIPNNQEILTEFYGYSPTKQQLKSTTFGLNKFSKMLLKCSMKYKDKRITTSNWERYTLTDNQSHYAADDALIGYKLFKKAMKISNINDNQDDYLSFCYGNIDTHHYMKAKNDGNYSKKIKMKSCSPTKPGKPKRNKKDKSNKKQGKTKAFFDNCKILKPNGDILSCCSAKGMKWYLRKNLAQVVDEKTIKLNFEPNVKGVNFNQYHQSVKQSQCFVCGIKENLCKFAVVPECYRQYIDDKYNDKANRIHDCIPLCIQCNKRAMYHQNVIRDKLIKQYSIPHYKLQRNTTEYNRSLKAKKAAWALTGKKNKIPIKRKISLLSEICDFYDLEYNIIYSKESNGDESNKKDIGYQELIDIKNEDNISSTEIMNGCIEKLNMMRNDNLDRKQWQLHSQKMVEIFREKQTEFIELWRKAFVDDMKPKYLPQIWTVSYQRA